MARSDRKQAAAKFRRAIARSNRLHAEYLDDPVLFESYDGFTRWQLDYMLPFFSDLLEPEGYAEAVDFIVSDLAGVAISDRDRDIERATPVIVRSLPGHPLEAAAAAVELPRVEFDGGCSGRERVPRQAADDHRRGALDVAVAIADGDAR